MNAICIACGMPMRDRSDHSLDNPDRNWCRHCTDEDGRMFSYEQTLVRLTQKLTEKTGMSPDEARKTVAEQLAELPAWRRS